MPHILLPLALSFVTFQQIAFLVDCYKQGKEREEAQRLESNIENNRESKRQHSLTQATLSTTTAKEKRFIPSPLPLAQKSKATAFLFCNQGESLAISASSTQAAIGTTAYRQSAFAHHEAGENRCAFGTLNELDSANAESQKPTPNTSNEIPDINFLDYCLFITFFPQLIAGPIVHHREMMPQFHAMNKGDSVSGEPLSLRGDAIAEAIHTKTQKLDSSMDSKETSAIAERYPLFCHADKSARNDTNLSKPTKDSRIFTQEVQNVAKSQVEAKVDSNKSLSDSKNVEKNAENVFCGSVAGRKDFGDRIVALQGESRAHTWSYVTAGSPQQSAIIAQKPTPNLINWEYIAKGLFIFSIGLFKKVVIADSFAKWANAGSTTIESGTTLNLLESWACALSHMFEYYFDFSGYCDMVIGLGLLFGIVLPVNFNSPFKSLSIAEFWRRWHMTLGRFLKHYVYIPLGGSRVPLIFNLRNLFIVFLVSGIWHGAGFGFIIWGCIHGISVCIHRLYTIFYKKLSPQSLYTRFMRTKLYIVLCWGLTFFIVLVARVFYISPNLESAFRLLKGMFFGSLVLPKSLESKLGEVVNLSFGPWLEGIKGDFTIVVWILGAFALCLVCRNSVEITDSLAKRANAKMLLAGCLFAYALMMIAGSSYTPKFLYFNF